MRQTGTKRKRRRDETLTEREREGGGGGGRETDRQTDRQTDRLLYYLVREIKTWLNINHTTVHNETYKLILLCILKLKEQLLKIQK